MDLVKEIAQRAHRCAIAAGPQPVMRCRGSSAACEGRKFRTDTQAGPKSRRSGVGEKHRLEADGFGNQAARQGTERETEIVEAVKSAEYSTALILTSEIDAGHFARDHPDALRDAYQEDPREQENEPRNTACEQRGGEGDCGARNQRRARAQAVEHRAADGQSDESSESQRGDDLRAMKCTE
jgi:hypothetical protein